VEQIYSALLQCSLFKGFQLDELERTAGATYFDIRDYARGQIVAIEGEACSSIGIVVGGSIVVQRIYASGKQLTIDTLAPGNSFGEAIVFSDLATYPATIIANQEATVVYLAKQDVVSLCAASPVFLTNFMHLLSNKILMLNQKIKSLSYCTVRQKVANFILDQFRRQQAETLHLDVSRGEMADALGIPQPSLSRELIAMREAGWIDFERRTITIKSLESLEYSLEL
jgi:CRP-like cAMP-binding protein